MPDNKNSNKTREAPFTIDGLAGGLPFGVGNRQCPGRNFAKIEIIIGFAILFSMPEIELLDSMRLGHEQPDLKFYGLGTLPPKRKVPLMTRKRT